MSQTLKQVTAPSAQTMQTSGLKANGTAGSVTGKDQFLLIKSANTLKSVWSTKMEAPKKSWEDLHRMWVTYEDGSPMGCVHREIPDSVGWVRADLVDELVRALEGMLYESTPMDRQEHEDKIVDALEKIKEGE